MIIISKKRIQILLSCILLGIFAFSFQIANHQESNKTQTEQTLPTTSTPVSGKTIVVDAGHGVPDEGAQSSTRYNRSGNKFKNSIKIAKFIRK